MKTLLRAASALLLCAGMGACATVTRGTSTRFNVTSEPPGAEVHASNGSNCQTTPCTFRLSRKDDFDVTVSKPGYQTQTVHVRSKAAGVGVAVMVGGNFLLGGPIGAGVDAFSGATNDLDPNPLNVVLVKKGDTASAPTPATPTP